MSKKTFPLPTKRISLKLIMLLLLVCTSQIGCVRRRMTIRSNPPGAMVYIDDQPIGVTPVSTSYLFYGTRKIQLFKDGFETHTVLQRFDPPWYEYPPLDFFAENFWPEEIRDERVVNFQLLPQRMIPTDLLISRAQNLRDNAWRGQAAPLNVEPTLNYEGPAETTQPFGANNFGMLNPPQNGPIPITTRTEFAPREPFGYPAPVQPQPYSGTFSSNPAPFLPPAPATSTPATTPSSPARYPGY